MKAKTKNLLKLGALVGGGYYLLTAFGGKIVGWVKEKIA